MDLVSAVATGVVTLVLVTTGLVAVGFVVLFRRRGDRGLSAAAPRARVGSGGSGKDIDELRRRAGTLLVRLDDAVRGADEELGFAIAQFGPEAAGPYAVALAGARAKVAEAFRLKQALDDHIPDTDRQKREWTLQIIALCEQAEASLGQQDKAFATMRAREVDAANTLREIRARIQSTSGRLAATRAALGELGRAHGAATIAGVAANPDAAAQLLAVATGAADAAAPGISAAGVSSVSSTLQEAAEAAHQADQLLDAVDSTVVELAEASTALSTLRARTRDDLDEAKRKLADAPDPSTAQGIIDAIAGVESALEVPAGASNPIATLDSIGAAVARLDLALASARNQAQRLEHARVAYEGTLVSAKSQIGVVRAYIVKNGAGVSARTRLAEAERQLMLAEAESDPVEALDAVRRAVTHARDADALARY